MKANLLLGSVLFGMLVGAGCGLTKGDPCHRQGYDGECSTGFDSEMISCAGCPKSAGFTDDQGICTTEIYPSESACQAAYPPGGTDSSGEDCNGAWTCAYDGQASPMCGAACVRSGSERTQTCAVLASMLENGNAGECCTVCR